MKYRPGQRITPKYEDGSTHIPKIEDIKEELDNSIERNKKELIKNINEIDDEEKSIYEINEMKFEITWIKKLILLRNKLKRLESYIQNNKIEESQIINELYDIEDLTIKPERMCKTIMKRLEKEEDEKDLKSYFNISRGNKEVIMDSLPELSITKGKIKMLGI